MKILNQLNRFYGQNLYIATPVATVAIAMLELLRGSSNTLQAVAFVVMSLVSVEFAAFYFKSNKSSITYCLIELYLLYYVGFLAVANHISISDGTWFFFICTVLFGVFFILSFNIFEKCRTK